VKLQTAQREIGSLTSRQRRISAKVVSVVAARHRSQASHLLSAFERGHGITVRSQRQLTGSVSTKKSEPPGQPTRRSRSMPCRAPRQAVSGSPNPACRCYRLVTGGLDAGPPCPLVASGMTAAVVLTSRELYKSKAPRKINANTEAPIQAAWLASGVRATG
jgi:hypothetical protein